MTDRPFHLSSITIGDTAAAWTAAGFTVDDHRVQIATTTIHLVGDQGPRGIVGARIEGWDEPIDGMAFTRDPHVADAPLAPHANGTIEFDHLVAMSPDMDRTQAALAATGIEHRRTRTFEMGGRTNRQAFYWLGDVILELAGSDSEHGEAPANLWGLAFTCDDLDGAAARLGERLGRVKPAVQRGRRIATLRTGELDVSVPIALMSPHDPDA